jgi:hypothetical protein
LRRLKWSRAIALPKRVKGTADNDTLDGTGEDELMFGGAGNDLVRDAAVIDIRDVTRRYTFVIGAGVLASVIVRPAQAQEGPERHGMSAFGDLKYPPDACDETAN